ncbi:PLP-dependent transferase [Testicularia cyperi]|uniref:PLP-dependent transferase n=1 Tax=Testicularia cyperi TaxID=1882483 RepID=A0A317XZC9_9BASI|nr:PLP-dependent transferase [Testicularia cyperi]
MTAALDAQRVRAKFPALSRSDAQAASDGRGYITLSSLSLPLSLCGAVYAENAGGSQVLASVAESISTYLLNTNVQMANYGLAHAAEERVALGTNAAAVLVGAEKSDEVMIGQSATQLVFSLSLMIEHRVLQEREAGRETWQQGDEIIVSDADHETNRGAWVRLAKRLGLTVKPWPVTKLNKDNNNPYEVALDPGVLAGLVTPKTRLVAFTACSNLLGAFTDISGSSKAVRAVAPEALVCVDCVAFAPHRRLKPRDWNVDVAFFSLYKTFGAHVGAMYVSPSTKQRCLKQLNHFFLEGYPGMYPYQSSSVQYELNHSIAAVADYLISLGAEKDIQVDWNHVLARQDTGVGKDRSKLSRAQVEEHLSAAFGGIAQVEQELMEVLVGHLASLSDKGVRIVGPTSTSSQIRAPTISFVVIDSSTGSPIPNSAQHLHKALVDTAQVGAQQGHMYAPKLVESLGLDLNDGVVRLSLVHYNTVDEARRITGLLDQALASL